uniref:Uncharacterized protein n=1 Tax=Salarias fasciatus TaxID=181472 RepID=A0A672HEU3_SALFA
MLLPLTTSLLIETLHKNNNDDKSLINTLSHTERRIFREALNTNRFSRHHGDNGSISRLQSFGVVLNLFARTAVNLLLELVELAGDVSSVTVQHRGITLADLPGVVQNDLSSEIFCCHRWVILTVTSHVSTTDFLDGHVFNVEADVITGQSLGQRLVVHLHRLHLSGQVGRSEGDNHTRLDDAGLNTANRYGSDT